MVESVLPLMMSRVELFKDKFYWKYGFSLTAQETTIKFIANNKETAVMWCNRLKRMCEVVSSHFSNDLVLSKSISRVNCWKIKVGWSAGTDGKKYSVKSIAKDSISENLQLLVINSYI